MAEVWRATYCPEGGFQKPVAIKRVLPTFAGSEAFVEMFREEARLCASLNHPNIVQVFDCGRFKDSFILAMEYVDGLPLNRLLKRLQRPLPLNAVTYLASELANALDYIHRRVDAGGKPLNLVHRDVNPPNILLSRIGEVKLGDFGVANAATRVETGRTDIFYGKLHYAAPEQIVVGPFDGRADLFALGLTLIETLTLSRVYTAEDDASLNKGIFPRIPRPSELRQDIPPALEEVVMRLVTHDLNRRTPTGAELRAQLMKLEGLMAAYPGGQASLAAAVEEAILLGPADSKKAKVTQLPAKDGGEKLTAVFAREQARGQSSVSRSMPAKRKGPSIAGAAAPTANMRAIQTGKSARAPVSPANAQSTQALTSEELERALEEASSPKAKTPAPSSARSRKGSSPPAPVAHDSDEDTVQEMPPPPKSARTK
ncbi:MAG: protein kinase [Myxococcota bacterium]|nr:protein kinase [Myxococcota bacterium]